MGGPMRSKKGRTQEHRDSLRGTCSYCGVRTQAFCVGGGGDVAKNGPRKCSVHKLPPKFRRMLKDHECPGSRRTCVEDSPIAKGGPPA